MLKIVEITFTLGSVDWLNLDLRLTWQQQYCPWELETVDALILTLSCLSQSLYSQQKLIGKKLPLSLALKEIRGRKKRRKTKQYKKIYIEREQRRKKEMGGMVCVSCFFLWNYRLRDYLYVTFGLSSETRH